MDRRRPGLREGAVLCLTLLVLLYSFSGMLLGAQQVRAIQIAVVQVSRADFDLRSPRPIQIVVQARDDQGRPIRGVILVFILPSNGASAYFATRSQMLMVSTGPDGRATATIESPNGAEGEYTVQVNASYQGLTDAAQVKLTNVRLPTPPAHFPMKWVVIGGAVAGAATVAAITIPGNPQPTTINAGGATIK